MSAQQSKTISWKFPFGLNLCAKDRDKAYEVEPLDKLPGFLLPSTSQNPKRRPPTLYLGWLVEDEMLIRLAKERGIGCLDLNLREYLKDEHVELNDEDFDEEPEEPNSLHMKHAFVRRCKELPLQVIPGLALVYDSSKKDTTYVIALMSNYQIGMGRLVRSDWAILANEFKIEGDPKWYLDYLDWHWN